MKFNVTSISFILLIMSYSAMADEPNRTSYGITFTSANQLLLKKNINEFAMVYTGIGLSRSQITNDGTYTSFNSSAHSQSLVLGVRDYLSTNGLSKFINLEVSRTYTTYSIDGAPDQKTTASSVSISYGIESQIAPNLSIEGSAGVGYNRNDTSDIVSTTVSTTSFPAVRLALTYSW